MPHTIADIVFARLSLHSQAPGRALQRVGAVGVLLAGWKKATEIRVIVNLCVARARLGGILRLRLARELAGTIQIDIGNPRSHTCRVTIPPHELTEYDLRFQLAIGLPPTGNRIPPDLLITPAVGDKIPAFCRIGRIVMHPLRHGDCTDGRLESSWSRQNTSQYLHHANRP